MARIAVSTLVLVALVAGVAAYFLTGSLLGSLPPLGWGWVTLPVVAVIDLLLALRVRSAISDGGVGQDRRRLPEGCAPRDRQRVHLAAVLTDPAVGDRGPDPERQQHVDQRHHRQRDPSPPEGRQ